MTTFIKRNPGVYDPETDTFVGASTTTITGSAVEVRPYKDEEIRYRELGLVEQDTLTLLFVPDSYGDVPEVGSEVSWAGETYVVRAVRRIAPDGVTLAARIGLSR